MLLREIMAQFDGETVEKRTRILLVDDHPLVRIGVRLFLAQQPRYEVAGEAADAVEAMRKAGELHPDLVLVDIKMPGLDGFALARWLEEKQPKARVVMLSSNRDAKSVVQAIEVGARGYVRKDGTMADLLLALERVRAGLTYYPAGCTCLGPN